MTSRGAIGVGSGPAVLRERPQRSTRTGKAPVADSCLSIPGLAVDADGMTVRARMEADAIVDTDGLVGEDGDAGQLGDRRNRSRLALWHDLPQGLLVEQGRQLHLEDLARQPEVLG